MLIDRNDRYQRWLEWSGAALMCLFLLLFAINLALQWSPVLFANVSAYLGLEITPSFFVITAVMGAIVAPVIPRLTMLDAPTRNSLFSLCAAPLLFYTVSVGLYLWQTGTSVITAIVYLAILLLVALDGAAIYRASLRHQRFLTTASVIVLCFLMIFSGWGFLARPNAAVFETARQDFGYRLTAHHIGSLVLLSAIAFPLLLTPVLKRRSLWLRRAWFSICVSPMGLYLIPFLHYMLKTQIGVGSAVLLVLLGFVAHLGLALERT